MEHSKFLASKQISLDWIITLSHFKIKPSLIGIAHKYFFNFSIEYNQLIPEDFDFTSEPFSTEKEISTTFEGPFWASTFAAARIEFEKDGQHVDAWLGDYPYSKFLQGNSYEDVFGGYVFPVPYCQAPSPYNTLSTTKCSGTKVVGNGVVASENAAELSYYENSNCKWKYYNPSGGPIRIKLMYVGLNSTSGDSFQIYDDDNGEIVYERESGFDQVELFVVESNEITISWRTDDIDDPLTENYNGFRLFIHNGTNSNDCFDVRPSGMNCTNPGKF